MKYFRFAFMAIYDNIRTNLLMIIEIVIVLLGVNIIVGAYNNRNMLVEPYREILEKTGWYMVNDKNVVNNEPLLDEMKGDLKQVRIFYYLDNMGDIPVRIKIVPDEIIDNMKLSVQSGKWETSSERETVCISAPNRYGISAGDVIRTDNIGEIRVSAVLTDPCYIPDFTSWSSMGGVKENFYKKYSAVYYDEEISDSELLLVMSASEFSETGLEYNASGFKFILYDENPTAENIAHNEKIIKENYNCGVPLSSIKYRAELDVKNLLNKYLPVAVCAFIVILIGFINCTAVNTLKQMRNYGILFICGMKWSDCTKICSAYTAIVIFCSVCLSVVAFSVCNIFDISAKLGLQYESDNIIISAFAILIIFLLNLIVPAFIINRKTPVEIIREGNL